MSESTYAGRWEDMKVCDENCFGCKYPDCILDEMTRKAREDLERIDSWMLEDSGKKRAQMTEEQRRKKKLREAAYRERNREKIKKRRHELYMANRDRECKKRRIYYEEHKAEIAGKNHAWYEKNKGRDGHEADEVG